jgi:chloramphenicol 3-O phosphotransferase
VHPVSVAARPTYMARDIEQFDHEKTVAVLRELAGRREKVPSTRDFPAPMLAALRRRVYDMAEAIVIGPRMERSRLSLAKARDDRRLRRAVGTVIFLNGASSSGKGTLARALQESLDGMFLHVEMDYVLEAMYAAGNNGPVQLGETVPPKLARGTAFVHDDGRFVRIEFGDEGERAFRGFMAMVAGFAEEGNNLIVDGLLADPWIIPSAAARLSRLPVYLVGVRCPVGELERREQERGDRFPGIARASAENVHKYVPFYDVEVDTASNTVEESVRAILSRLASGEPQAIKALDETPAELLETRRR